MRRVISIFLVLSICILLLSQGSVQAAGDPIPRIYGGDRYETAVKVSRVGWDQGSTVILTRGDDFADALAGTPLAYAKDAPILLTKPTQMPLVTKEEIERLGATEAIILGGPGAVSEEIGIQLEKMGLEVRRIFGATRYETAAAIAKDDVFSMASTAVLVNGVTFPDSLAVASYAARNGFPIILTEKDSLPACSRLAIGSRDVLIIGGQAVVGQGVESSLEGNVDRIAGANRAATSVSLARYFQPGSGAMYIATGQKFADALAGSVLAAKEDSGLLLVSPGVSGTVRDYLHEFEPALTILGGENAVSKEVAQRLMDILSYLGENIEFLKASTLAATPGGAAIRYPCKGHVTTVLDVLGEYLQIQYGSKVGWVPRKDVVPTAKNKDYIRMTWNYTSGHDFVPEPSNVSGYNVYAPVSHTITNYTDGTYSIKVHTGRNDTIGTARKNGYLTWMTVQQFGRGSNLSNALAADIVAEAKRLDVDGINVDFENMGLENRDKFSAFMTGLASKAKEQGFVLSVDVTRYAAGSSWSLCYDRTALGKICDYVVLMAYDQTPAGSSTPGPVAGHPWTKNAVNSLLEEVTPEKILLGIPFYNRVWVTDKTVTEQDYVHPTGSAVAIRTEPTTAGGSGTIIKRVDGSAMLIYLATVKGENILGNSNWYKVDLGAEGIGYISAYYSEIIPAGTIIEENTRSGHYSYRIVKEMVDNFDPGTKTSHWTTLEGTVNTMVEVSITYHSGSQQNLLEYTNSNGSICKIWLEDVASLKKRLALAKEKGLGGLAAWSINWMDGEKRLWNAMLAD